MIDFGITLPDGTPLFDLDKQCTSPKRLGYQMIHQDTGRILPTTKRNEIYSAWAATEKMGEVALAIPTLDVLDYIMKPVYDFEVVGEPKIIRSLNDPQ